MHYLKRQFYKNILTGMSLKPVFMIWCQFIFNKQADIKMLGKETDEEIQDPALEKVKINSIARSKVALQK